MDEFGYILKYKCRICNSEHQSIIKVGMVDSIEYFILCLQCGNTTGHYDTTYEAEDAWDRENEPSEYDPEDD